MAYTPAAHREEYINIHDMHVHIHAVISANYRRAPAYFNCSKCIGDGNQCHSLEAYDLLAPVENGARTVKPYLHAVPWEAVQHLDQAAAACYPGRR